MAEISKIQLQQLFNRAPEGLDKRKIVKELLGRGHTVEGLELPTQAIPQQEERPGFLKSTFQAITKPFARTLAAGVSSVEATGKLLTGQGPTAAMEALTREREVLGQGVRPVGVSKEGEVKKGFGLAKDVAGTGLEVGSFFVATPATASFGTATKTAFQQGGRAAVGSVVRGVGAGALVGGSGATGAALQDEDKSLGEVAGAGALGAAAGGAIGGVLPTLGAVFGGTLRQSPRITAVLTGKPETALREVFDNPQLVDKVRAIRDSGDDGAIAALEKTRGAAKNYRAALTESYKQGKKKLVDLFEGQRMGLSTSQQNTLQKITEEFPLSFDDLPTNLNSFSVSEALDLNAALNDLNRSRVVRESGAGAIVRGFRNTFKQKTTKTFGGENGPLRQFLTDYGVKSEIFNNFADIVKPFKTGTKTSQSALNNLRRLFGDNKEIYMKAISEFEEVANVDLLDDLVAVTLAQNESIGKATGLAHVAQETIKDGLLGLLNIGPEAIVGRASKIFSGVNRLLGK
jgi:hypothetical protein